MNWSAIAAIAELIGAVGVIFSLIYLGSQIKQGATAAKWAGAHEVMTNINDLLILLGGDGETAKVWARGLTDFESLDTVERVRFSSLMLSLTNSWDEAYHAMAAGQIDAWGLQRFTGSIDEFSRMPGFRSWHALRKQWLSDEMRKRLEVLMRVEPSAAVAPFYSLSKQAPQ